MIYQQKVDFQVHYLPKIYYDFLEEEGLYCPDGFPAPEWDEAWQQEAMTELCISYALLSISSPGVFTGNKFRSRELARKINEEGAQIVSHAPGNLGFLATLPLPLVHSSIFEARCCLDELHADGVGLMTNYGGVYLGDRRLDELMAELDGRGALAVMHPTQPAVMVPDVNEEIPVPAFEYFVVVREERSQLRGPLRAADGAHQLDRVILLKKQILLHVVSSFRPKMGIKIHRVKMIATARHLMRRERGTQRSGMWLLHVHGRPHSAPI